MKHSTRITTLLLIMFLATQLLGILVIKQYAPEVVPVTDSEGNITNVTRYDIPYGMNPPPDLEPKYSLLSIVVAIILGIVIMLFLMKHNVETFFRIWFFVVVTIAIAITFNAFLKYTSIPAPQIIALAIALPLAFLKIFKRNILIHNLSELAIYPGIAVVIAPLFNLTTAIILTILISLYDMYAVWHTGIMQKMAKYQIQKIRVFTGFFLPYLGRKEREYLAQAKAQRLKKKIKVNIAILGGGDVVFPLILAAVVYNTSSVLPALFVSFGATLALATLFFFSKKGKFYPAMPFIATGCFIALIAAYLSNLL